MWLQTLLRAWAALSARVVAYSMDQYGGLTSLRADLGGAFAVSVRGLTRAQPLVGAAEMIRRAWACKGNNADNVKIITPIISCLVQALSRLLSSSPSYSCCSWAHKALDSVLNSGIIVF